MIKRFTISHLLALCFLLFAFPQANAQIVVNSYTPHAAAIIGSGREIAFTNPATYKVWNAGTQYTGVITVPVGYTTVAWSIIDHASQSVITTGTSLAVTYTFSYTTGQNVYDLKVISTRSGYPDIDKIFYGEIRVLPPAFLEAAADLVVTLTGQTGTVNVDGAWTDRGSDPDGYKIYVKGNCSCRLNPFYFRSTVDSNPVIFQFNGNTITGSSFGFTPGPNENVIFSGLSNTAVEYGLKVVKASSGTDQVVFFSASDVTHSSRRVTIAGVWADNVSSSYGGSGFQVATTDNTSFNYSNYTFDDFLFYHNKIENTRDEGLYFMHFTDEDDDANGRRHAPASDVFVFDNYFNQTGNEGIQLGSCFNCEVFSNTILDWGTRNQTDHRNAIQWSGGNQNSVAYANFASGSKNIFSGFTGQTGFDNEFFANVFYTTGKVSGGVNVFVRVEENDTDDVLYWGFFQNTMAITDGIPFSLYNDTGSPATVMNPMNLVNNLIVTNTATHKETVNGFVTTNLVEGDYQTTDLDGVFFFDRTTQDYHLATSASPGFTSLTSHTPTHVYADRDFEGVKYLAAHPVKGAFSGYENFTGAAISRNITSAAAQTDINDIPNGTSFATLESTYLPATGLVTNADGSTRRVSIDWAQGSYDGNTANTYTLTGTITSLPSDVTNSGAVTFSIDVEVDAAAPSITPINFNFNGQSDVAGWERTGSLLVLTTSPYPGTNTTRDYGTFGPDGIGLRALNPDGSNRWNATLTNGSTTGADTGIFPDAILTSNWYADIANAVVSIELYNLPAGSYRVELSGSRASSSDPPRNERFRCQNGTYSSNLAVHNNTASSIVLTGCIVTGTGVLKIDMNEQSTSNSAHLCGLKLSAE